MFIPTHLIVVENKYGLKWLSCLPNYNMQRCDFMMRMTGAHLTLPFYFVVAGVPVSGFFSFFTAKGGKSITIHDLYCTVYSNLVFIA